jgi:hypothetical protein
MTLSHSASPPGEPDTAIPLEADPEGVVQDLVDGIISEWSLRNIYKVGYDAETLKVDREETAKLRAEERQARLARGKHWAEFQAKWFKKRPPDEILRWFGSWPEAKPLAPVIRM